MYSQFFYSVIYITKMGGEFTNMALKPEEEPRKKRARPARRETTATIGGTGLFGIHLDFWPFSVRGEYPADKTTHDAESARAMQGRRQTGRNQTQQTK